MELEEILPVASRQPPQAHPRTTLHPAKIFKRLRREKAGVEPSTLLIVQSTEQDFLWHKVNIMVTDRLGHPY